MKFGWPLSVDPIFVELIYQAAQYPLSRTNNLEFVANFTNQVFCHKCFVKYEKNCLIFVFCALCTLHSSK